MNVDGNFLSVYRLLGLMPAPNPHMSSVDYLSYMKGRATSAQIRDENFMTLARPGEPPWLCSTFRVYTLASRSYLNTKMKTLRNDHHYHTIQGYETTGPAVMEYDHGHGYAS